MNKPVNFEIAKLLKEKRFGLSEKDYIQLPRFYEEDGSYIEYRVHVSKKYNLKKGYLGADTIEDFEARLTMIDNSLDTIYLAPTISEVVMWLYKRHGIWIEVVKPVRQKLFRFNVDKHDLNEFSSVLAFDSPIKAYKAAIEHTLNNLI